MTNARYDVLGLGNAIVDVIARADDDFLVAHAMAKGTMRLIDEPAAEAIYAAMGPAIEVSGGSAANTTVGVASLGGRSAFLGKVKADPLGGVFRHDITAAGVAFPPAAAEAGPGTGRCYILVTPDGERTMNTFLGAAQHLSPADVVPEVVSASAITYLEGYLWDPTDAKAAFIKAASIAHDAGRKVALSLSDAFCVDRWRDEFRGLVVTRTVDILFANESELHTLYQTADFDTALASLRGEARLAVVTRGDKGAVVVEGPSIVEVPAEAVERVVDTTGAGDLFAAGFLLAHARGRDHATAARIGALAAAEVISHMGARPERQLSALAAERGLGIAAA